MALLKEEKAELIKKFQNDSSDTGSSQVQIALLTENINKLQDHFKKHKKEGKCSIKSKPRHKR